jgi:prephenate dehydratase
MKIAIQGEKGSFHEVAARQYFYNENIDIVPCTTFDSTLSTVNEGKADLAMMAIENARSGSILYNYNLIRESGLKMLGEHNLRIRQNLMALPGQTINDIKQIRSHPSHCLCMTFLNQYPALPSLKQMIQRKCEDYFGTQAEENRAIASSTADIYGLEICLALKHTKKTIQGFCNRKRRKGTGRE